MKNENLLQLIPVYKVLEIEDNVKYFVLLYATYKSKTEYIFEREIEVSGYSEMLKYCLQACRNFYNTNFEHITFLDHQFKPE